MSDNPLKGISIPSYRGIGIATVDSLGIGTVDLANPLQRRRLAQEIEVYLSMHLEGELERAIEAVSQRAIAHVFKVMRDSDYQEKKLERQKKARVAAMERKAEKDKREREARMDYSRKHLEVSKATVN